MARLNDFMEHPELVTICRFCLKEGEAVKYDKGQSFVNEGSICRYIAIVLSGYFKYIVFDEHGDECTTGFSFEGDIVTDYVRSFIYSQPSLTSIVAGADSDIDMYRFSPVERYTKLVERIPGLLTLVPLKELASYLSVSRRQFQRIRKQTGHLSHDR